MKLSHMYDSYSLQSRLCSAMAEVAPTQQIRSLWQTLATNYATIAATPLLQPRSDDADVSNNVVRLISRGTSDTTR
jgi:hypothetical protein